MAVQIRSETTGLGFVSDVKSAYNAWKKDSNIWKISWDGYRFRPKTKEDRWDPKTEERLAELCPQYRDAKMEEIFWVDQKILPHPDVLRSRNTMSEEEFDQLFAISCISEILPDEEFRKKFIN